MISLKKTIILNVKHIILKCEQTFFKLKKSGDIFY